MTEFTYFERIAIREAIKRFKTWGLATEQMGSRDLVMLETIMAKLDISNKADSAIKKVRYGN